jgi:hypothetical protein
MAGANTFRHHNDVRSTNPLDGLPHMTRDLSRQSFLGEESDLILASVKVGVIGLCGGGSHTVQQ